MAIVAPEAVSSSFGDVIAVGPKDDDLKKRIGVWGLWKGGVRFSSFTEGGGRWDRNDGGGKHLSSQIDEVKRTYHLRSG